MYYKALLNLFFILLVFVLQLAIFSGLPFGLGAANIIIIALIFVLALTDFYTAVWGAIIFGFLLDIYSFNFFGVYLISLFVTILFSNFLLVKFFTNRSSYSFLALVFLTSIFYQAVLGLISFIQSYGQIEIEIFDKNFWVNIFWGEVINFIITLVSFYLISFLSKKLKPAFLIKND
ncbi:MAG: hypothetical protein PHT51_02265 [Patescibacteria group bacterium]|nr:hypothetical protein [Patescibacteria group bacterium]MDD4610787.1 hypothetical protein [Patescibacteria group bacterium]